LRDAILKLPEMRWQRILQASEIPLKSHPPRKMKISNFVFMKGREVFFDGVVGKNGR